jgi:hypothetical protein
MVVGGKIYWNKLDQLDDFSTPNIQGQRANIFLP